VKEAVNNSLIGSRRVKRLLSKRQQVRNVPEIAELMHVRTVVQ
jgi:hypothetical protein